MTKYHQESIERKKASIALWKKQPITLEECLAQFKMLREQRLARESELVRQTGAIEIFGR